MKIEDCEMFNVLLIFSSKVTENNLLRMARHFAISSLFFPFLFLLNLKCAVRFITEYKKGKYKMLQMPLVKYLEEKQQQQQESSTSRKSQEKQWQTFKMNK